MDESLEVASHLRIVSGFQPGRSHVQDVARGARHEDHEVIHWEGSVEKLVTSYREGHAVKAWQERLVSVTDSRVTVRMEREGTIREEIVLTDIQILRTVEEENQALQKRKPMEKIGLASTLSFSHDDLRDAAASSRLLTGLEWHFALRIYTKFGRNFYLRLPTREQMEAWMTMVERLRSQAQKEEQRALQTTAVSRARAKVRRFVESTPMQGFVAGLLFTNFALNVLEVGWWVRGCGCVCVCVLS